MPVYQGSTILTKVYRGETEITKIYRGDTEIYSSAPPADTISLSVTSMTFSKTLPIPDQTTITTSSSNWTASSSTAWCFIGLSPTPGGTTIGSTATGTTVYIRPSNNLGATRTAVVTFACGTATATVNITQ